MDHQDVSDDDVKSQVKAHWGHRAHDFDERPNHGLQNDEQHRAWSQTLATLVGPATVRLLDLGCGTGFLSLLMAELGHQVTGVDIAPEMIELARQKAKTASQEIDFQLGDVEQLDCEDASYDLIMARHLIWTLPNPNDALAEWRRVLKPGGQLALIEGHWENQSSMGEYDAIRTRLPFYGGLPSEQLARVVNDAQFNDVVIQPLMDAVLWGETPRRPRYVISSRKAI